MLTPSDSTFHLSCGIRVYRLPTTDLLHYQQLQPAAYDEEAPLNPFSRDVGATYLLTIISGPARALSAICATWLYRATLSTLRHLDVRYVPRLLLVTCPRCSHPLVRA